MRIVIVAIMAVSVSGCISPVSLSAGVNSSQDCDLLYPDGEAIDCTMDLSIHDDDDIDGWVCLNAITEGSTNDWEIRYEIWWNGESTYGVRWESQAPDDWESVGDARFVGGEQTFPLAHLNMSRDGFRALGNSEDGGSVVLWSYVYRIREAPPGTSLDIRATEWNGTAWYTAAFVGNGITVFVPGMSKATNVENNSTSWHPTGGNGVESSEGRFFVEQKTVYGRSIVAQAVPTSGLVSEDCS